MKLLNKNRTSNTYHMLNVPPLRTFHFLLHPFSMLFLFSEYSNRKALHSSKQSVHSFLGFPKSFQHNISRPPPLCSNSIPGHRPNCLSHNSCSEYSQKAPLFLRLQPVISELDTEPITRRLKMWLLARSFC